MAMVVEHQHLAEVDYNDEVETSEGKSREERLEMYMDAFMNKDYFDTEECFREFASSRLDMIESEGFDMGYSSQSQDEGMMLRFYDPPTVTLPAKYLDKLIDLSNLAIDVYNQREGTNYRNVQVLKTITEPVMGIKYYITFKAFDKIWENFQARVYVGIPTSHREVELVRVEIPLKPILIIKPRGAARWLLCLSRKLGYLGHQRYPRVGYSETLIFPYQNSDTGIICREGQRSKSVPTPVV